MRYASIASDGYAFAVVGDAALVTGPLPGQPPQLLFCLAIALALAQATLAVVIGFPAVLRRNT